MDDNLSKILISEIRNYLPDGKRLVPFLMETLGLGKESIYRRLRNNISFSLEEIIKLSIRLGFSIDEIIGRNDNKRIFFDLPPNNPENPSTLYSQHLKETVDIVKRMNRSKGSRFISAHNRLPLTLTVHLRNISRFRYFRWLHQNHNIPLNFYFSDIAISPEIHSIYNNLYYNFIKMEEVNIIMDRNVFISIIEEITYYYKRDIIKKDELILLKDELLQIVDRLEILTEKGINDAGTKINIFVSSFNIESTYGCFEYENNIYTQIWSYIMSPITINKPEICAIQKKRIEAYKKFSILITQCNEIQRSEYLKIQRRLINNMTENIEVSD